MQRNNNGGVTLNMSSFDFSDEQVLYTLGGVENILLAKKYYASTIDLTGGKNTKALFGICLVSFHLHLSLDALSSR